jgi:hypothetical protein
MRLLPTLALALLLAAACAGKGHTQSPDAKKVNSGVAGTKPAQTSTTSTTTSK